MAVYWSAFFPASFTTFTSTSFASPGKVPKPEADERSRDRRDHLAEVARFLHWAIVVPVEAAAFRLRAELGGAEAAVDRLRAVLRAPGRCARFLRLAAEDDGPSRAPRSSGTS
jgi:hypothetical protein